ncbi:MAG: hypothetical protein R3B57_00845 [Phycisphaerales bacterium]
MRGKNGQTARRVVCVIAALGFVATAALGHGEIPKATPIDRLIPNLEQYVAEHPDSAEAHYRLGRAHAMILQLKRREIAVWDRNNELVPAQTSWQYVLDRPRWGNEPEPPAPEPFTEDELCEHLAAAITNLNRAIEMDPSVARFHLALGSALDVGREFVIEVGVHPLLGPGDSPELPRWLEDRMMRFSKGPLNEFEDLSQIIRGGEYPDWNPMTRRAVVARLWQMRDTAEDWLHAEVRRLLELDWQERCIDEYFLAMTLALPSDGKSQTLPLWGGIRSWVSYEAAECFIAAVEARGEQPEDRTRLAAAIAAKEAIENLPRPGAITPIVFSTGRADCLVDLTISKTAPFDLDGSGITRDWSWVSPDTAILVWDSDHTGKITSGRQLFGNATWWVLFEHGYQALDALDDDRNGSLRGDELVGVRAWFDRNTNGVSDEGEVVDLDTIGVVALGCRVTGYEGASPICRDGVELSDGSVLPSYDWIAHAEPARGKANDTGASNP